MEKGHKRKLRYKKEQIKKLRSLMIMASISLVILIGLFVISLQNSTSSGTNPNNPANGGNGNVSSEADTTAPVLTLTGDTRYIVSYGVDYKDPGYTAIDDTDGDITTSVTSEGNVDIHKLGEYTITYTATDSSGNTTTAQRIVVVKTQSDQQAANPPGKVIYLSFDDGPTPYTEQLLDILDEYNVKVTFFVTNQSASCQDVIGEIYRRGHTVAMHSYSHKFQDIYCSEAAYYKDLYKLQDLCESKTGVKPTIIRFPGGTCNAVSKKYCTGIMTALTKSVTAKGFFYCDWNVDSNDAGGATTAEEVYQNVITGIQSRNTSYVLQHDTYLYSIEAVDDIIRWGLENGYTFLPLTEDSKMIHQTPVN